MAEQRMNVVNGDAVFEAAGKAIFRGMQEGTASNPVTVVAYLLELLMPGIVDPEHQVRDMVALGNRISQDVLVCIAAQAIIDNPEKEALILHRVAEVGVEFDGLAREARRNDHS